MGSFAINHAALWKQLSDQIGATYTDSPSFGADRVEAKVDNWVITLDTFQQPDAGFIPMVSDPTFAPAQSVYMIPYTRLRAPFANPDNLDFTIHRAGLFSGIGKALGFQDITIGDPEFDKTFVITGNDETKIVSLLQDEHIRQLLAKQPQVFLDIRDNDGWFGPDFPADTDELYFLTVGEIVSLDHLKELFDLFATVLHRLTEIGAASDAAPGVSV